MSTHFVHPEPTETARRFIAETPLGEGAPAIRSWILRDLEKLFSLALQNSDRPFFRGLLDDLAIEYECEAGDILRIPKTGPVVVTANHPFGLAEGPILGAILSGVRHDFKFLANSLLGALPQLRDHLIPVNPFGGAAQENSRAIRDSVQWVRQGGALLVFPAGEVASLQWPSLKITDPQWTDRVARLVKLTNTPVLPMFFHGTNSPLFHLAGLAHPRFRTALLPRELLNKRGSTIRVSIGSLIPAERLSEIPTIGETTAYLRARTALLGARGLAPREGRTGPQTKIALPSDAELVHKEIQRLPSGRRVAQSSRFQVYVAAAHEIPHTLREIGRLREVTFRQVGEGSGREADLDEFDAHYQHLFLWNDSAREVAGAYRFARVGGALPANGGLYTDTLFHLSREFWAAIGPAIELGRSFVRAEYQRSFQPLLLLWKGIGQIVAADPQYKTLFGAVSISKDYSPSSRALMVSFCEQRRNQRLAASVRPRRRFSVRPIQDCNFSNLVSADMDDLSTLIADVEPDRKGVPILLKQYLNLGGQVLDFSVDPKFSNALDGLVVVDLTRTGATLLEKYMGKVEAREFLHYHRVGPGEGLLCLEPDPALCAATRSDR